jgi:hypothetical protein
MGARAKQGTLYGIFGGRNSTELGVFSEYFGFAILVIFAPVFVLLSSVGWTVLQTPSLPPIRTIKEKVEERVKGQSCPHLVPNRECAELYLPISMYVTPSHVEGDRCQDNSEVILSRLQFGRQRSRVSVPFMDRRFLCV